MESKHLTPRQIALYSMVALGVFIYFAYEVAEDPFDGQRSDTSWENVEREQERVFDHARISTGVVCKHAMAQQLRARGTADFPFGHSQQVEALGGNLYRLRAYVDAENAFGGEVRTNFLCVVQGSGEDVSGYRIVDFEVR